MDLVGSPAFHTDNQEIKKRIYLPTTKDAHSGLPAGFLPDGVGNIPSHRKKPVFECSVRVKSGSPEQRKTMADTERRSHLPE